MRAACFVAKGEPLVVEDVTFLPPGPRDVVVELEAAGVCHTDLSVSRGVYFECPPAILGHEGVGNVVEVGAEVTSFEVGDRVLGLTIPRCGACVRCRAGEPFLCEFGAPFGPPRANRADGTSLVCTNGLGTFAERMTVADRSLVKVDTDLPAEQVALVGCGLLTGIGSVFNAAQVVAGSSVLLVGAGGVGQAVVQGARIAGAERIIVVDPVGSKRDLAKQVGATDFIDPNDGDVVAAVQEVLSGRGVDYAFDTVGTGTTFRQAYQAMRRGGRLVVIGVGDLQADLPLPGHLVPDAKTIIGTVYGHVDVTRDAPMILGWMEDGSLDVGAMVTRTSPLDGVNEALHLMETGEVLRTVLVQ